MHFDSEPNTRLTNFYRPSPPPRDVFVEFTSRPAQADFRLETSIANPPSVYSAHECETEKIIKKPPTVPSIWAGVV